MFGKSHLGCSEVRCISLYALSDRQKKLEFDQLICMVKVLLFAIPLGVLRAARKPNPFEVYIVA